MANVNGSRNRYEVCVFYSFVNCAGSRVHWFLTPDFYSMLISKRFTSFFAALVVFSVFSALLRAQESSETLPAPIVVPSDSGAYRAINQLPASIRSSAPFARE